MDKMKNQNKTIKTKEEVLDWIKNDYAGDIDQEFGNILITAGAGDIDTLVEKIRTTIEKS